MCGGVVLVRRKRGAYREIDYWFRRVNRDDEENKRENKVNAIRFGKACYPLCEDGRRSVVKWK